MKYIGVALIIMISLTACSPKKFSEGNAGTTPGISVNPTLAPVITPTTVLVKEPPMVMDMEVLADRSYQDFFSEDPYSQLTKYIIDTYHPDRELYNLLFKAIVNKEKSVDTSSYKLTPEQIMNTVSGIYEQAGLQLFYMNRAKWSKDYKTINITYREVSEEQIKNYQDTFYSQMNHLLYNVAPSDYDPYQKFFAVYEYVTKHAGYTDDMNDDTTTTPGSLLVNQKSICGGFSSIANYVLNFVGVPTDYISNDAHAWNIVNLMGNYYCTDFTWGAIYDSNISFLNTALMNSKVRKMGLDKLGYGDSKSIVGYPGGSEETPEDCTDNRYDFLKDIYENYALDIDNKWIYYSTYSNDQGIHRIRLDGTGEELVTPKPGFYLKAFDGVLYFADADENMMLYQWEEGKAPVSLDSSAVTSLELKDNKLRYNVANDMNDIREISLSKFISEKFKVDSSQHFEPYQLSKNQTFQIVITFSDQMLSQSLENYIGLISSTGKNIPISMIWSENYKKLTIRSMEFINQEDVVSLEVESGIEAVSGLRTVDHYDRSIQFIESPNTSEILQ